MARMKRLLTWLAFVGFSAVSITAVVRAVQQQWNKPPAMDRAALEAWLTTPHENESPAARRRAARRLEQDFYEGVEWEATYVALPVERRRTLERNWTDALLLIVRQQAESFAALPRHRREAFLDERLVQLGGWYGFSGGRKLAGLDLLRQSSTAAQGAAGESPRLREYVAALQARGMQRVFQRFLPPSTAPPRADD